MNTKSENILARYVPASSLDLLMRLLRTEPIEIKIKPPRVTKFGDYRFPDSSGRHRITVNSNLNSYAFLITLLHEIAHLSAFKEYGKSIKPHGKEWQNKFIIIAKPFIEANIFPEDLRHTLIKSLKKGSSSSCTDLDLYRALKSFDEKKVLHLEDVEAGSCFSLKNKMIFKKGPKARKRYKCLNLKNGKEYMIHPLAEITIIESQTLPKSA